MSLVHHPINQTVQVHHPMHSTVNVGTTNHAILQGHPIIHSPIHPTIHHQHVHHSAHLPIHHAHTQQPHTQQPHLSHIHIQPTHTNVIDLSQSNQHHATQHQPTQMHHNGFTVRDGSHPVNGVRYDPVSGTGCYGPIHKHDNPHPSNNPHPNIPTDTNTYDKPDSRLSDVLKFGQDHKISSSEIGLSPVSTLHDGKITVASSNTNNNGVIMMTRSVDLTKPTKECGGWSITIPPVGSFSQTKCDDGSKTITSCLGVPGVFQDCGTLSTGGDGSQTYTDSTKVGPFSWSSTFDMTNK